MRQFLETIASFVKQTVFVIFLAPTGALVVATLQIFRITSLRSSKSHYNLLTLLNLFLKPTISQELFPRLTSISISKLDFSILYWVTLFIWFAATHFITTFPSYPLNIKIKNKLFPFHLIFNQPFFRLFNNPRFSLSVLLSSSIEALVDIKCNL